MAVKPEDLARNLMLRHGIQRRQADERGERLRARLAAAVGDELAAGRFRRAWLVGSLAWGGFDAASDVDLVVEGLAEADAAGLWDRLSTALGAPVDLLRLETLPPGFAQRVVSEGERLDVS